MEIDASNRSDIFKSALLGSNSIDQYLQRQFRNLTVLTYICWQAQGLIRLQCHTVWSVEHTRLMSYNYLNIVCI